MTGEGGTSFAGSIRGLSPVRSVFEIDVIGADPTLVARTAGDSLDRVKQGPEHVRVVVGPLPLSSSGRGAAQEHEHEYDQRATKGRQKKKKTC